MKKCGVCNGMKAIETYEGPPFSGSPYIRSRVIPCVTCNGTGSIEEAVIDNPKPKRRDLQKPIVTGDLRKVDENKEMEK